MNTPRLDAIKKLLTKELREQMNNKSTEDQVIKKDEVIENCIKTYIEEMSSEILELNKEKYKQELKKLEKQEEIRQYIKKTRKILYEGLIMAFVVGLAVNQFTDLIGLYKGTLNYSTDVLKSSLKFSFTLLGISVLAYGWKFIVDFIEYINNYIKKEKE